MAGKYKKMDMALAKKGGCTCDWVTTQEDQWVIAREDESCPLRENNGIWFGRQHPEQVGRAERITREFLYMEMARLVAKRSTCRRGNVGAILVRDRRIISMGYNGAPPGMPHCLEVDCLIEPDRKNEGCQRTVHAEANAIAWAARQGVPTEGAAMWTTHAPCTKCAHLILSAGIREVNYAIEYRLQNLEVLQEAGVEVIAHDD